MIISVLVPKTTNSMLRAPGNRSAFAKSDDSLWISGQLGIGNPTDKNKFQFVPTCLVENERVIDAAVGQNQSLFLMEDGSLWVMGSSANGQLGTCGAGLALLPTKLDNDCTYPGKYRLRSTETTVPKNCRDGFIKSRKNETV